MAEAAIGKDTPVSLKIGALVAIAGFMFAAGMWAASMKTDSATSAKALESIDGSMKSLATKVDEIDKKGTTFGKTGDLLIRKDLEALESKVDGVGKSVEDVRSAQQRQWELMREIREEIRK